jgi:GDP-4-dehydro-6-deoxy-D-mannose reductase
MQGPILVTGAAGFAGSHLVDLLVNEGTSAVAWARPGGRGPHHESPSLEWRAVDILDRDAVRREIARTRPATVFHCAGAAHVAASWSDRAGTFASNVLATHYLLDAIRREKCSSRVLIPGSAAVYKSSSFPISEGDEIAPASPYALSKLGQEIFAQRTLKDDGIEIVVARAFNHLGPRQEPTYVASSIARQLARIEAGQSKPLLEIGNVDAQRDLTDVRDMVRAYRLLVEKGRPGIPYNVCSGRACSVRELVRLLVEQSGVRVEIRTDPSKYRPNDAPLVLGNPARLRNETGWSPEIALSKTLTDLLNYWRDAVHSAGA